MIRLKRKAMQIPMNRAVMLFDIPTVWIDSGISSKKEIHSMTPAAKLSPVTIALLLFWKTKARRAPIMVVIPEIRARANMTM